MPEPTQYVSVEDVLAWLGSDATIEEAAEIIAAVANGHYKPKLLKQEILDYSQE
jgi:hypothetical protein